MKWTRDGWNHHQLYTLGPAYESGTYNTAENTDTKSFATGLLEGSLQYMSHDYELFDVNPEAGDLFGFNFDARHPGLGFTDPLLKLDSTYVKLSRLTNSGRGTIVGGVRLNIGTTWVSDSVGLKDLPPSVKFFGGGSDDIRGFLLKTLPKNDGQGALTRTSLKLELRRTSLFKESIEAFAFLDNAYFGEKSWSSDPRLWYSPGIGFRWLSPIGLLQAYVSRALATAPNEDLGNFLYAGFGGTSNEKILQMVFTSLDHFYSSDVDDSGRNSFLPTRSFYQVKKSRLGS
jgi:outer membrane translocation and assembly module TamA